MKVCIFLLTFLFSLPSKAQEKDTLFFSIDPYYTISPTIIPNFFKKETYSDWLETTEKYMKHTKTNGNIFFIGDGCLIKNLKPGKILSIKEYIENRKFYYDGKYNQIVDERKLKNDLTDKYIIYFVNKDEFIQPRNLQYSCYYPRRDKDGNFVQNNLKDTLFFKLDNDYIYQSKIDPEDYLIKDASSNEHIFFKKGKVEKSLNINKLLNLMEFVQSSRFYDRDKRKKLNDSDLANFLGNYVVYFVSKNSNEFILVHPSIVIYD